MRQRCISATRSTAYARVNASTQRIPTTQCDSGRDNQRGSQSSVRACDENIARYRSV